MANQPNNSANLGFEDKLWAAADKLRGNMDAAEYKHVVLGLIFLKYISDAFMEKYNHLAQETADPKSEYYVKEERARYGVAEDRVARARGGRFWIEEEQEGRGAEGREDEARLESERREAHPRTCRRPVHQHDKRLAHFGQAFDGEFKDLLDALHLLAVLDEVGARFGEDDHARGDRILVLLE